MKWISLFLVAALLWAVMAGCATQSGANAGIPSIALQEVDPTLVSYTEEFQALAAETCFYWDYKEEAELALNAGILDSLYLVQLGRAIAPEESKKLPGYDPCLSDDMYQIYEAVLLYDYWRGEEVNRPVYYRGERVAGMEQPGMPPYAPGDSLLALVHVPRENSQITHAVIAEFYISPGATTVGENTDIYSRDADIASVFTPFELPMTELEKTFVTTRTENPVIHQHKYHLGDIVNYLTTDMEARGFDVTK